MTLSTELSKWVSEKGPENDIVLSSRIRLARNIEDFPYPNNASQPELTKINSFVRDAVNDDYREQLFYIRIDELPGVDSGLLVEKNLVSPEFVKEGVEKALLLNKDENISIMINEEDHVRMQILQPGLQLEKAWQIADELDDKMEETLNFAFTERWGYLSACPTNLGTGLRASVMVHLPGLNLTDNISRMLEAVSKLGLVVRGIYGEGSNSVGNIYQISNQITIGSAEEDIVDNLNNLTRRVIEQERHARNRLLRENEVELRDRVKRSFGTLKYAYRISSEEAMKLLSRVKLGIDMGIIDTVDPGLLSKLIVLIRPAHLQKYVGEELSSQERDIKRAELIQSRLNI